MDAVVVEDDSTGKECIKVDLSVFLLLLLCDAAWLLLPLSSALVLDLLAWGEW